MRSHEEVGVNLLEPFAGFGSIPLKAMCICLDAVVAAPPLFLLNLLSYFLAR
jgi:adenine-specific DNA methylase